MNRFMNWLKRYEFGIFWITVIIIFLAFWIRVGVILYNLIPRATTQTYKEYENELTDKYGQKYIEHIHRRTAQHLMKDVTE